jgi:3-phenylpropionate/trans-cinnamate dioxygenase ferredoxin reductase subunit
MNGPVVIVGAGQAGVGAAEALRAAGYGGELLLLGDEPHGPYHRPPLSKAWLAGEMESAQLTMRAPELLARKNIDLRTGVTVTAVDRAARQVVLADGTRLPYAGLVLATGATPRALALSGADVPNVLALRTRADADAMREWLDRCAAAGQPVVVVGGGFIGLEVAATARKKGAAVTVLEAAPRLLGRVLAPMLSDWYADLHRSHGVRLVFDARPASIETANGRAVAVRGADGTRHPAGLVVVGIGVQPNDAVARAAGLECERGIVVDACARTSDPHITAAGDCTARRLADGGLLRLESVQNATEQAKSAAAALMGEERPFTATPWFWSDQYDRKLQMAGLSGGADQWVVRGSLDAASFSVFHYRAGRLVSADSVNNAREHLLVRRLLDAGVSPAPAQAADSAFDLAALLRA